MVSFLLIYLFAGETNFFKSYIIIETKLEKRSLQKEVYQMEVLPLEMTPLIILFRLK